MSVTVDREAGERVTTTQRSGSTQAGTITEINGLVFFSSTPDSLMQTVTSYSDFLEVTSVTGPGGTVSSIYDGTGRLSSRTITSGSENRTESYAYYGSSHASAGQLQTRTAPYVAKFSGNTSDTTYTYDSLGRQVGESGAGTYPVKFSFNAYGDREKMTTYRSFTSFSEPGDDTEWHMDPASGLLLAKEDAEGKGVSYTYHAGTNLLKTKTLARLSATATPIVIRYGYDALGRLVATDYSDSTPDVAYAYRRDGGVETLVDGAGTHTFGDWSADGLAQRKIISGNEDDALAGLDWRMPVDGLGRRTGYSGALTPERGLMSEQTVPLPGATWTYGTRGEVWKITSGSRSAEIGHSATGSAVERTLTRTDSAGTAPALTSVETSTMNQGMVSVSHSRSGFSQTRGLGPASGISGGLSAAIDQVDPDFGVGDGSGNGRWQYAYNTRGELVNTGERQYQDTEYVSASLAGSSLALNDIGSEGSSPFGRKDTLTNSATTVWGMAPVAQVVSLDGTTAARSGPIFRKNYSPSSSPTWQEVAVAATGGTDSLSQSGHIYLPPALETFVYDEDGNLIEDGRWNYTWDAENRLVDLTTRSTAVEVGVPELRLSFAYDAKSRRVRKLVEKKDGVNWEVISDTRFVYDGWNVVAEVEYFSGADDAPKSGAVTQTAAFIRRNYVWGPDVSGTWEGAGGVGGLLSVTRHQRGTRAAETFWATMDLNGNVIGLLGTTTDRLAAYEYDAYGKCVRANEPEAGLNPVRFSSKYQDEQTELVYYGYRYHSPKMRQWVSRDPIGEEGGVNLYQVVANDTVSFIDRLGLSSPHVVAKLREAAATYLEDDINGNIARYTGLRAAITRLEPYADMASEEIVGSMTKYDDGSAVTGMFNRYYGTFTMTASGYSVGTAIHESIHAYNHFAGTGVTVRNDEAMAYLTSHLHTQVTWGAASMESLARLAATGEEFIGSDELEASWADFWDHLEESTPTVTIFGRVWNSKSNMTPVDVSLVRERLGVKFKCSEVAEIMNNLFPKGCYRYECTTREGEGGDIYRGPTPIFLKKSLKLFK